MKVEYIASELSKILGVSIVAVHNIAKRKNWKYKERPNLNGGGICKHYITSSMDVDTQKSIINSAKIISCELIPMLSSEAALAASLKMVDVGCDLVPARRSAWTDETAIDPKMLHDPRVKRIIGILQEVMEVPPGWKKSKWRRAVAKKHDTTPQSTYKWEARYRKAGIPGIYHSKGNKGKPKKWTPEAIDYWIGLCLKRDHRKIAKDALYDVLITEAHRREWNIGCYESALWWYNNKVSPQLLALQRGGARALDNTLPPVLRSYADLDPFDILVGDQHKFDFWVVDDETGQVFRPEGYFWQDLRTRLFYGGAVDKKYDAHLCGLALRIGCRMFGAFKQIYTDNGRPELSRYIMGILSEMRTLGMYAERTIDAHMDTGELDGETVNPCTILPGTHRKAIVKNAKAKMIEGTFNVLEGILRDHFNVPGYCKRLTDSGEEQDIDQKEIERLALAGKLLTFREFVITLYKTLDYYNKEKVHRGVLREWAWKPRPRSATPRECLKACYLEEWRPRYLSPEAIDLVFLARVPGGRVVDRGRVWLNNMPYEHHDLAPLHKIRMDVRYDPMDPEWVLVFNGDEFVCRAVPVEYSSMKDKELASRKIEEKRRHRKEFLIQYREITSRVPDIRNYSKIPPAEKAAAAIAKKDIAIREKQSELTRQRTPEELAAEIAQIENYQANDRPLFTNEVDRYQWCLIRQAEGYALLKEDGAFVREHESQMNPEMLAYWKTFKESIIDSTTVNAN